MIQNNLSQSINIQLHWSCYSNHKCALARIQSSLKQPCWENMMSSMQHYVSCKRESWFGQPQYLSNPDISSISVLIITNVLSDNFLCIQPYNLLSIHNILSSPILPIQTYYFLIGKINFIETRLPSENSHEFRITNEKLSTYASNL